MPRRRSRSRSVFRNKHKCSNTLEWESSNSESEDDCPRGRPICRRIFSFGRPRSRSQSQSGNQIVINNNNDICYHRDHRFGTNMCVNRKPDPPYFNGGCGNCDTCGGWGGCGHRYEYSHHRQYRCPCHQCAHEAAEKEKREEAAKKAKEEEEKKAKEEKEKREKFMREFGMMNGCGGMLRGHEVTDYNIEIAGCNGALANLQGLRRQIRCRSRPGVRFEEFEEYYG